MSAALNTHADTSLQSTGTHPDLSLSSLAPSSGFSTPARALRVPSASTSSHTTATSSVPVRTPSPPGRPSLLRKGTLDGATPPVFRRLASASTPRDEDDAGVLNTPDQERRWQVGSAEPATPMPGKGRVARASTVNTKVPTLRDQEKQIDNLKKENFDLKLKVHFLEERLAQLAPDQTEAALRQNVNLKVEVQNRSREAKKMKKRAAELERALDHAGAERDALDARVRELERRLAAGGGGGGHGHGGAGMGGLSAAAAARAEEEMRELEARNGELKADLDEMRELLQDHIAESEHLREVLEAHEQEAGADGAGGSSRLRRKLEELEGANADLRDALTDAEAALRAGEDERDALADEVDALRAEVDALSRRREAESMERSESRAMVLEERDAREEVEDALNAARDRLAAATIELQQKEDEVDAKNEEIVALVDDHEREVEQWREEVREARLHVEELRDVLDQRENEAKDLREHISELEASTVDLHNKFEEALAHLDDEAQEKDQEIAAANTEIQRLSDEMYLLEEQNDRLKEESDRLRLDEADERQRLEGLTAALKDKCTTLKAQLQEVTELYEQGTREVLEHRQRQEELAAHVEALAAEVQRAADARERLERDADARDAAHADALRRERRTLEAKESALQSALVDLARTESLLSAREADHAAARGALEQLESVNARAGETHLTAQFSLQLEVDRLTRDVTRLEDELAAARRAAVEREAAAREREAALDRVHADNRKVAAELAAQTQARLNVSEKLDSAQAAAKAAEADAAAARARVAELEQRLSKDQRSLLSAETQYRDQLTERNTLLLTIYQYMDKILGVDKTPKKAGQAETKPFTNFGVFHDNLITRLKALSQIQLDFDKRSKATEARFVEKLAEMRRQLDARWRQVDKFEASVKVASEAKAAWRKKMAAREGELEAIKLTNAELAAQLSGTRKPGQTDPMELRSLQARATNAERRLINAQNQLVSAEERLAAANQKTTTADGKWEARVREYETRLKAAEEKVKRERQGAKETNSQLESQLKSLQRQKELADKRNQQLNEMVDTYKTASPSSR